MHKNYYSEYANNLYLQLDSSLRSEWQSNRSEWKNKIGKNIFSFNFAN